ncbi:MAG: sugar O-acetyltransferase [Flavobacteriia bacterium]|nr:sugar O-acetyltransferase [Flavobacteriia bacterium]OJX35300.1 MAG: maltose O-acetyltransferase [Flavobacteriia bacterium 40-80]
MKTEWEKMLSGEWYLPLDAELSKKRYLIKKLIHEINLLSPDEHKKQKQLFQQLFQTTQKRFWIEAPFFCDYGENIVFGEDFFANYHLTILDGAKVTFGDHVKIGPNVSIFTIVHPINAEERARNLERALPITIGNNVWIGGNAVINQGVSIGDNTVIGSGSVVTKNLPANVFAAGNPCRIIREIKEEAAPEE